jgi:hypothetical protein
MRDELVAPDFPAPEAISDDLPAINPAPAGGDHWEDEKEKLALALTERILRGRDSAAFSELKNSPIFRESGIAKTGEIVLALLRIQARQIIRQEKPLVLQSKRRFELEDDDIRGQLRRLRDLLAERLVFDKNEVQAVIAFAVRLQFDLLTKPRAALERLIYFRSPQRRKADIFVILEGLDENHQFVAQIKNLLAESSGGPITKEEFSALCRRAESEVYGAHPVPAMIADLQMYQQFCASLGPSSSARIERQIVLQMLRERGLRELAENAQPELMQHKWWAVSDIAPMLERALAPPHLPIAAPAPVMAPPVTEFELSRVVQEAATQIEILLASAARQDRDGQEQQAVAAQVSLNLESENQAVIAEAPISANGKDGNEAAALPGAAPVQPAEVTETAVRSESAMERERALAPEIPPPAEIEFQEVDLQAILQVEEAAIPPAPKIIDAEADAEAPLIVTRASLEAQPPGPYPSITRLIDGKSRIAFIRKIFHKDLDAYLGFIEALEAAQTWKEAKALLDGTFKQRKVNPFSKEAVQLSDVVFSRYFTQGAK